MYIKLIQNTKFVYILHIYKDCTNQNFVWSGMHKNVHQTPTYIQKMYKLYKTCSKFKLKTT